MWCLNDTRLGSCMDVNCLCQIWNVWWIFQIWDWKLNGITNCTLHTGRRHPYHKLVIIIKCSCTSKILLGWHTQDFINIISNFRWQNNFNLVLTWTYGSLQSYFSCESKNAINFCNIFSWFKSHHQRYGTIIILLTAFSDCSTQIIKCFKMEVDSSAINWIVQL